ncbi:hypothetical protein B7463_g6777, partial [Scytalidium lignicola]
MKNPSNGLTGSVVSIYIAGEACGAITQIFLGDRLGRIRFMQFMCVVVTIACAIQTASVNIGMFLFGRFGAGYAVGGLVGTVPIYLSEISAPKIRGMIGGISGLGIVFGIMISNWIGFACSYIPYGSLQWRLPLAIQIPWGIILFIGLWVFMPNSPRELVRRGKIDEARYEFIKIRSDLHSHEVHEEFVLMKSQIQYEMHREITSFREIYKLYRHRVLVSIAVAVLTGLTGVNVIQYYQTTLYKSLGFKSQTILCLAGVFGTVSFLSNLATIKHLPDRWGRRKMLLTGMVTTVVTEIYAAVMQHATINCVTWLYGAEILPMSIRSKVMGVAAAIHFIVNVGSMLMLLLFFSSLLTEAGPSAFANIRENYYYVFVACCFVYFFLIYFYFPETKQKTLEEIAASFNDRVVEVEEQDVFAERTMMEGKAGVEEVEHRELAEVPSPV